MENEEREKHQKFKLFCEWWAWNSQNEKQKTKLNYKAEVKNFLNLIWNCKKYEVFVFQNISLEFSSITNAKTMKILKIAAFYNNEGLSTNNKKLINK